MSLVGIGVEDDSENSWITKLKNKNKKTHKKQKYTQDITLTTCRKERNSLFSS